MQNKDMQNIVTNFMQLENLDKFFKIPADMSLEDIQQIQRDQNEISNLNKSELAIYEIANLDVFKVGSIVLLYPVYMLTNFALAINFILPKIKNDISAVAVSLGVLVTAAIASVITAVAIYSVLAIKAKLITGAWLSPGERVFYKKPKNDKKSAQSIEMSEAISISPSGSPARSFESPTIMSVQIPPSFTPPSGRPGLK